MSEVFVPLDTIEKPMDRRAAIRSIAAGLMSMGVLDLEAAQHVHNEASAQKKAGGKYDPKELTAHEFQTVTALAAIVVPADEVSGSAVDAGAPEFIDLLCSQNAQLAGIFHGGLAWMDAEMRRRHDKTFLEASASDRTALLDALVKAEQEDRARRAEELVYEKSAQYRNFSGYTTHTTSPLLPGVRFFDWIRKMSIDAFYTSPLGVKDLGYVGNKGTSKYEVPKAAIDFAMKRSPFA